MGSREQPWWLDSIPKLNYKVKFYVAENSFNDTSTKILYLLSSRSCKVIDIDTINKHVTIACYDKQHVYVYAYLQPFLCQTSQ